MTVKPTNRVFKRRDSIVITRERGVRKNASELLNIEARMRWIFFNTKATVADAIEYNKLEHRWKCLTNYQIR